MTNNDWLEVLLEWWKGLENDRGGRAELKRAKSPDEVVFSSAYHRLYAQLKWDGVNRDILATIAGLAAHIKENDNSKKIAEQMALSKSGGSPIVSSLRFRRILAITDRNELYVNLIRVLRILKGEANLSDLAQSVYWWNKRTKKEWAYQYYAIAKDEK